MSGTRTGHVNVAFRVRPLSDNEVGSSQSPPCIQVNRERRRVSVRNTDGVHHFTFDRVFDELDSQSTVYKESVAPLVKDFVAGRNVCILAYGEFGSGKTHTIMGKSIANAPLLIKEGEDEDDDDEDEYADDEEFEGADDRSGVSSLGSTGVSRLQGKKGSISNPFNKHVPPGQITAKKGVKHRPLARAADHSKLVLGDVEPLHTVSEGSGIATRVVTDIFEMLRKRRKVGKSSGTGPSSDDPTLSFSFVEVYNERIIDLLDVDGQEDDGDDNSLSVVSSHDRGSYLPHAVEIDCRDEVDISDAVQVALATRDRRAVTYGFDSAGGHAVFLLKMERYSKSRGKRATSNLFLVDLANSALVRKPSSDASTLTLAEGKSVKKSLGALRKSIRMIALSQKSTSTPPHGDSQLTKLLRNALSRGSGISMIVTANPLASSIQETMSAIRFGTYVAAQVGEEKTETEKVSTPVRKNGTQKHAAKADSRGHPDVTYGTLNAGHSRTPKDPREKLHHVTALLEIAAKNMQEDLVDLDDYDDRTLTTEDMERQLVEVTKELESMKYDGHLATQIQHELQSAQEELQRLKIQSTGSQSSGKSKLESHLEKAKCGDSELTAPISGSNKSPFDENQPKLHVRTNDQKSTTSSSDKEVESLRAEIQALKKANDLLNRQQAAKSQELATARQLIQELKVSKAPEKEKPEEETPEILEMFEGVVNCSAVSNKIPVNSQIKILEDKTDNWDEQKVNIGPSPVCVCLRLRPMTKLERNRRSRSCIEVHEGGREFTVDSPLDGEYDFCFDHVFDVESNQEEVYETVGVPIVEQLLGGVNCAVMVYGLSGSGKSHTLSGKLPDMRDEPNGDSSEEDSVGSEGTPTEQEVGFSPRLVADLFRGMKDSPNTVEYRITCSYVCIYLEKIFDLLDPRFDKSLIVRDTTNGIRIEGAVEAFCFDEEDVIHLIRRGAACRKLIGNKLTMEYNRSHSILILNIEQHHIRSGRVRRSYLKLVELAGFEVTSKAKGQSMQETKIIHKSFSALGNVIKSLTEGNPYAPYRESKLTSLLKEALGGNCKTTLFITASPSSYHISETINSIRLGQRVRRVTNKPRINIDASLEDYRTWLLSSEMKLCELTHHMTMFAKELVQASEKDEAIENSFSSPMWTSILAIAQEEESIANPCRKALILDEELFLAEGQQKWRALTIELARRLPSEKLEEIRTERNRAQSVLSDIQSESVVLRRQNELLVQEKRKKEEELAIAHRENRKMTTQNSEVDYKLQLAENHAKEAIIFLRYLRTLCWKLRKDIERDRPIDITEITSQLHGAPDLSGLVDFDSMMIEAGFLHTTELIIERVETEYFDYLQQAGLIIDEEQVAAEDEIDELAFLDDGLGEMSDNRWRKAQTNRVRVDRVPESGMIGSPFPGDDDRSKATTQDTFLGLSLPWTSAPKQNDSQPHTNERFRNLGVRNTRRERELQRDLQNMANKCVELQMELNEQRILMEALTNKASSLKVKKLAQEAQNLAKERDRMMHNAKAATWKLQELHVVNKLLAKQAAESKQQINFLEEGFQRLQESFRSTVQEGLDADQSLRDRVKALQSIVDSLTGPAIKDDDDSDEDSDDDTLGSTNPLLARVHLPLRGRAEPDPSQAVGMMALVDPCGPNSKRRCLILNHLGKWSKKSPSVFSHHSSKFVRKSFRFGTALIGDKRETLKRAYEAGKKVVPPLFLDEEEEDDDDSDYSEDYYDDDDDDGLIS